MTHLQVWEHMARFPKTEAHMLAEMWADAVQWGAFMAAIKSNVDDENASVMSELIALREQRDAMHYAAKRQTLTLDNVDM